jgi:hypothetical protein
LLGVYFGNRELLCVSHEHTGLRSAGGDLDRCSDSEAPRLELEAGFIPFAGALGGGGCGVGRAR